MVQGVLLIVISLAIFLFREKAKFERRGVSGGEEFPSFWSMLGTKFAEFAFTLVAIILFVVGAASIYNAVMAAHETSRFH